MACIALIRQGTRSISLKNSRHIYSLFRAPIRDVSRIFCIFALDLKLDVYEKNRIFDDDCAHRHGG